MTMPISPIAESTDSIIVARRGDSERGFTLIELLLAITIGSVVMGAVYATFNTAIGSQQRIQRVAQASQASRYFLELVRRDVKELSARADTLNGQARQLDMVLDNSDGTLAKVSYRHEAADSRILRIVTTGDSRVETIAYEGVKSLGFRYLMDGKWHTESNPGKLPQAIECALEIGAWVQRFTITLEVENVPAQT